MSDQISDDERGKLTPEEQAAFDSDDPGEEIISRSGATDAGEDITEGDDGEGEEWQSSDGEEAGDKLDGEEGKEAQDSGEAKPSEAAAADDGGKEPAKEPAKEPQSQAEEIKIAESSVTRDPGFVKYQPQIDLKAKQDELAALEAKYAEGDVDEIEFNKQYRTLTRAIDKEELRRDQVEAHNKGVLARVESEYIADFELWSSQEQNKTFLENDSLYSALCSKLEVLIKAHPGASNNALFDTAKKLVQRDLGAITPKDEKKPAAEKPPIVKPEVPVVSKIGGMPKQAVSDVGSGKFAKLNQLVSKGDTLGMERELRKFSKDEQDEWARG